MIGLKKFYIENKDKFAFSFNTLLNYIKKGIVKDGLFIVKNDKRDSYFVTDKDLFLANFK